MKDESVTSTVPLPQNNGELIFTVVPLNPILSEFKYIARVKTWDGRKIRQILEIQTGGCPDVMVLYFAKSKVKQYLGLDHYCGDRNIFEVIDLSDGSLHRFNSLIVAKKNYQISEDTRICNLGWITEANMSLE